MPELERSLNSETMEVYNLLRYKYQLGYEESCKKKIQLKVGEGGNDKIVQKFLTESRLMGLYPR